MCQNILIAIKTYCVLLLIKYSRIKGLNMDIFFDGDYRLNFIISFVLFILLFLTLFYIFQRSNRRTRLAKQREDDLLNENKMIDRLNTIKMEFFQNMSHDIKAPLVVISTSVLNMIDALDFDDFKKEEMTKQLKDIQNETMRLSRMVSSAQKLSTEAINNFDMKKVDLSKLISESVSFYKSLFNKNNNKLELSLSKSSFVWGNPDMLMHVMSNLFSNSNRYTKNGIIKIVVYDELGNVIVEVIDSGAGINPEILPKVFERGISDTGSGLGLSICKKAINETHKGNIDIKSTLGKGTSVKIVLPKYREGEDDDGY